jgi:hypothetical protein
MTLRRDETLSSPIDSDRRSGEGCQRGVRPSRSAAVAAGVSFISIRSTAVASKFDSAGACRRARRCRSDSRRRPVQPTTARAHASTGRRRSGSALSSLARRSWSRSRCHSRCCRLMRRDRPSVSMSDMADPRADEGPELGRSPSLTLAEAQMLRRRSGDHARSLPCAPPATFRACIRVFVDWLASPDWS